MKTSEILYSAAELLETKGWTQGALAKNSMDQVVSPRSPDAVCFCTIGSYEYFARTRDERDKCWHAIAGRLPEITKIAVAVHSVATWNDMKGQTAQEVILVIRKIAALEAAGGD